MADLLEAANPVAPYGDGETSYPRAVKTAITGGASTAAVPLTGSDARSGIVIEGRFVTLRAVGGRVYVAFGAATLGAADANDWPIEDGQAETFTIGPGQTDFRAYSTATCSLHWRISSP